MTPTPIKIRIWSRQLKRFVKGRPVMVFLNGARRGYQVLPARRHVIQQFIGALDKKRVEIYEGDIIQIKSLTLVWTAIIVREKSAWKAKWLTHRHKEIKAGTKCIHEWMTDKVLFHRFKVIGNILSTPKLIPKLPKNHIVLRPIPVTKAQNIKP